MTNRILEAQQAHQRGDLFAAESGYRAVLKETPGHAEAAHFLGLICVTTDRLSEGIGYLRQAVALEPMRSDWWTNLGEALRRQGELVPAAEANRQAVLLSPGNADAHFNLGVALRDLEDVESAMHAFRTVLALRPNSVRAHLQLGQLLRLEGKAPVALQHFQTAVDLKPDSDDGWLGLAATQLELANTQGAWTSLDRAISLQPHREEIPRLREDILLKQGRVDEARASFGASSSKSSREWWQTFRRELLCQVIPQSEEAVEEERERIMTVMERYRGERLTLPVDQLQHLGIEPPMALTYHGRDERPMKAAFAALYEDLVAPLPERDALPKDRPVMGVFVTTGHEGVYDRCLGPLMSRLAERGHLDVKLVSTRAGINVLQHLRPTFPGGYLEVPAALDATARTIRDAGIDLLHYWEIGTDSTNYWLPFLKPARIQLGTWGWPSTAGTRRIDGFVSSELLEPADADRHYVEQLLRLPSLPTVYEPPSAPCRRPRPQLKGIPATARLYVCVQNLRKLQPVFDKALAMILRADPEGWLLCLADEQPTITELFRQRLNRVMPDVMSRVRCVARLPREEYLQLVSAADVLLDSHGYGGGANTAADALATATPVVTWPGPFHRGRWQAAVNRLIGLDQLNADSALQFVHLANRIAQNPDERRFLSEQIIQHRERFFHNEQTVLEHEALFLQLLTGVKRL